MDIRLDDATGPEIVRLVEGHLSNMHSITPPGSVHALGIEGLRAPDVTLWSAWEGEQLLGCGALRALDPTTGQQIWRYDPYSTGLRDEPGGRANRGVAYWSDGSQERIFLGSGEYLVAIDAATGEPDRAFAGRCGRREEASALARDLEAEALVG